jgi:hypothetical protein
VHLRGLALLSHTEVHLALRHFDRRPRGDGGVALQLAGDRPAPVRRLSGDRGGHRPRSDFAAESRP